MLSDDFTSERRVLMGVLLAFLALALFAAIDISADLGEGTTVAHVAVEAAILLVGLLGSLFMTRRLVLALRRARAVRKLSLIPI